MTTAYEFAAGYTKLGIGTAPSSAPTITVVDSANNVLVAAATATTALTNFVGAYRYSYSGTDGLTCDALFHTTDTSMDQQDLFAIAVINPVVRDLQVQVGTAGAGLTAITGVTLAATQTGVTIPTVTTLTNKTGFSAFRCWYPGNLESASCRCGHCRLFVRRKIAGCIIPRFSHCGKV